MSDPLVRLSAIIILALLAASRAEQSGKTEDKVKLVTRVYRAPGSLFGLTSPGVGKSANLEIAPKPLALTVDGVMRYDVWDFFRVAGLDKIPGAEAIFLQCNDIESFVVVTGSPEMQGMVERVLGTFGDFGHLHLIETTASLWEYEDDQFADAAPRVGNFNDLRRRAGNSLRLLDSHLIVTKPGQRSVVTNKEPALKEAGDVRKPVVIPDAKPSKTAPTDAEPRIQLNGTRGSILEVEPTIGADGTFLDMTIGYEARLKRAGATQDTEINVATSVILTINHDAIAYCALAHDDGLPLTKGMVRRLALVIRGRLVEVEELTRDESEKQDERLINKARLGLGVPKK